MAINTKEKRSQSVNITVAGAARAMPVPTGTITATKRAHLTGNYFLSGAAPTINVAVLGRISIEISLSLS